MLGRLLEDSYSYLRKLLINMVGKYIARCYTKSSHIVHLHIVGIVARQLPYYMQLQCAELLLA